MSYATGSALNGGAYLETGYVEVSSETVGECGSLCACTDVPMDGCDAFM